MKANKTEVLRARVTPEEKSDLNWAAGVERLDQADIIRRAIGAYIARLKTKVSSDLTHAA